MGEILSMFGGGGGAGAPDPAGSSQIAFSNDASAAQQSNSGLSALLSDPQNIKDIGGLITASGGLAGSFSKLSPQVKQMLAQTIASARSKGIGQQQQATSGGPLNPYGGDMTKFLSPAVARGTMDAMGIPY